MATKKPTTYKGSVFGVSADVRLLEDYNRAVIKLSGIPLGGTLQGIAWMKSEDDIELDEDLAYALQWRHVKIVRVKRSEDLSTVSVTVKLPIFLGRPTINLHAVD